MGRTLFIGDVHGCIDEYRALLDLFAPRAGDRVVHVGDLVARGPDSLGVLQLARQIGAIVIRGNHEERLLRWRQDADSVSMHPTHLDVAQALSDDEWAWLARTPIWEDFPELNVRVVHAGLDPKVEHFADQDPHVLMHIRVVGEDRALWASHYAKAPHIVFGHHAAAGLQLHEWATGLDTGCVYGGQLTGLVLGPGEPPLPPSKRAEQLLHVQAKRVYVPVRRPQP